MNGLISSVPSQSAVRLVVSGFLLLTIQSVLLLLSPTLDAAASLLISVLTPIASVAFIAAVVGIPEPPDRDWRSRHGR